MMMDINTCMVYSRTLPQKEGIYEPFPSTMKEEIRDYLKNQGISRLYCHQTEMFEKANAGENVVITTSTASGKTLSFLLPVIQRILENPSSRAIFIYPTKALAHDQYRSIQSVLRFFGEDRIQAGVYDGDTSSKERSRIRREANIILTNPEILNITFLPNHSKFGFDYLFANLQYIIIDEMHTYRGIFGSHLANIFRRMHRVCKYYGAAPQFLCSSATIANPLELAEAICSKSFVRVERDGAPRGERRYILLQPPKIIGKDDKAYGQMQAVTFAADMVPQLIQKGNSFLTFTRSRRNVEVILKETRDKLKGAENTISQANLVSGYRGGYTPKERQEIEQKMMSGALRGLISTNALELGIDIGQIDTTVLVGYPGTRASFWQQTGRAGRSGAGCTNFMILEQQPFDQYIGINPDWLFENQSEYAVIDKNNLLIELAHIRSAAAELPLTLDDISIFPDLGETIPVLLRAEELQNQNGKFLWNGESFPAGDYSLRNMEKSRYKLMNRDTHEIITEMDEMQAFREAHPGAVYMHDANQYEVVSLDLETKTAQAIPFEGNYYTIPSGETAVRIIHDIKNRVYQRTNIQFGDVNVMDSIHMYKRLQFHNHQNLGYSQLQKPLWKEFDTESVWFSVPSNVVKVFRSLLQEDASGKHIWNNHFEGLCYAIKNAALMITMTEAEDIGTTMSDNALLHTQMEEDVSVFIYDKFVGGLGYAEKMYDCVEQIIEQAITLVGKCSCDSGCIACIGDYHLDKKVVLWGLENLLEESQPPKDVKVAERPKHIYKRKTYTFQTLPEKWDDFCKYLSENGDQFAGFCQTVKNVEIRGNVIAFEIQNAFYKEWVMQEDNHKSLCNILRYYTDAPATLRVEVKVSETETDTIALQNKLQKRYRNLRDN